MHAPTERHPARARLVAAHRRARRSLLGEVTFRVGRCPRAQAVPALARALVLVDLRHGLDLRAELAGRVPLVLGRGLLTLSYAENPGAFLSLGAGLPATLRTTLLVGAVGLLLLAGVAYLVAMPRLAPAQWAPLAVIAGGGLSNLLDRVLHAVRDGGAFLHHVSLAQPSLEDVYIHLTGRGLRE